MNRRHLSALIGVLLALLATNFVWAAPRRSDRFKVDLEGSRRPILWEYERQAQEIDRNGDGLLTQAEFAATASRLPGGLSTDEDYAINAAYEFAGVRIPYADGYPDSAGVEAALRQIVEAHPQRAALRLLGSTPEHRSVWALRLGPTRVGVSQKIAIISGQHAREWIGPQVALASARALLEDPSKADLLERFEVWVLPLANPDGYDYSLSTEAMWRKNRRGVDLNRNFAADYRRAADSAESFRDDWGGSDHPESAQYRGEGPASEPETRLMQSILDLPGMAGVVDVHGFGNKIVLPNAPTRASESLYERVSAAMSLALEGDYEVLRYDKLYPITGHSGAYADLAGFPGITLEVGKAFQPHPDKIATVSAQAVDGIVAFMRALP